VVPAQRYAEMEAEAEVAVMVPVAAARQRGSARCGKKRSEDE
jgi:hypothetical protein